jgi:hypothetical protein
VLNECSFVWFSLAVPCTKSRMHIQFVAFREIAVRTVALSGGSGVKGFPKDLTIDA